MYAHNVPIRLARALAAPRFAAGVVVTLALLSAACSDNGASRINAPQSLSNSSNSLSAAGSAPSLGAASSFAVLSALTTSPGAVTCTNSSIVGDVGTASSNPLSVTRTSCSITGTVFTPVSAGVLTDFNSAYDALEDVPCDRVLTGTLDGVRLPPGVYCFDAAATLTGTLTLVGPSTGTWLFKIGTGGTGALTGTNFNVVMAAGADPCNVTWWVAEAATMTTSHFIGTILAGAGITVTMGTAGTFEGRALAKAAVTITGGTLTGCTGGSLGGTVKCNQGVGNGPENCDPGKSNQGDPSRSNDEVGGTPSNPGRKGGNGK